MAPDQVVRRRQRQQRRKLQRLGKRALSVAHALAKWQSCLTQWAQRRSDDKPATSAESELGSTALPWLALIFPWLLVPGVNGVAQNAQPTAQPYPIELVSAALTWLQEGISGLASWVLGLLRQVLTGGWELLQSCDWAAAATWITLIGGAAFVWLILQVIRLLWRRWIANSWGLTFGKHLLLRGVAGTTMVLQTLLWVLYPPPPLQLRGNQGLVPDSPQRVGAELPSTPMRRFPNLGDSEVPDTPAAPPVVPPTDGAVTWGTLNSDQQDEWDAGIAPSTNLLPNKALIDEAKVLLGLLQPQLSDLGKDAE